MLRLKEKWFSFTPIKIPLILSHFYVDEGYMTGDAIHRQDCNIFS